MEIKLSFKRNGKKEYILNECDEFKIEREEVKIGYRIIGTFYPKSPVIMDEAVLALDETDFNLGVRQVNIRQQIQ